MIDGILRWSLDNRLFVLAASLALLIWGARTASNMPVDVFPDLTAPTVTVVAESHGMTPKDVEQTITFPMESALNGTPGVRRIRTITTEGIAVINIDFDWGVDMLEARQLVAERLQIVSNHLPPEAEAPIMGPMTSVMGDIVFLGLTAEDESVTQMDLRTVADWTLTRRLLATPGVAQVIPIGGDVRQYHVVLSPQRLDALGLTADEVAQALERANENVPAGFLVEGRVEHVISGVGRISRISDIENTFVTSRNDVPVLVKDLGEVAIRPAIARGSGGVSGKPGVLLGVRKQPDLNTLKLTKEIDEVLDQLEPSLPEGIKLHRALFRQADFIEVAVTNVSDALRDGAILVVLIVLLFLGSGRATFITATAIPLSLLTSAVLLDAFGYSLNTMTLGGMAISVGALVDDAIIDVENVTRRLREAFKRGEDFSLFDVVLSASIEIRKSIVFATGIIILVFVPLFFLAGVEGRILQPLGIAYVLSLVASLAVAVTVTPVLCYLLLPNAKTVKGAEETKVVTTLKRAFKPILEATVDRWKLLLTVATILFVCAIVAAAMAGRTFLPKFNEGALTMSIITPPGTGLQPSTESARRVENVVLSQPGVVSTGRRTGRGSGDEHAQPIFASELEVRLDREAGIEQEQFLAQLRRSLKDVPGVAVIIGQPLEHRIEHLISGTRAAIAVKVFGDDLTQMQRIANQVEAQMKTVPGVVDLNTEQMTMVPFISIQFKRRQLARYGLSIHEVADEIATAFSGRVATEIYEGNVVVDLVVKYDTKDLDTMEEVMNTRIGTPSGARVPLQSLATVQRSVGPNMIARENVRRKLVVMCNVADRDMGSVVGDIESKLRKNIDLPEGYHIEVGGQFESAVEAARVIGIISGFVLVGILLLLIMALGRVRDALLVLLNLPLALIGGVVGVYAASGVISIASLIGFITLFGIATRNGIMMVTHIQHLRDEEGVADLREAVMQGAMERLSPILMTALASGLGLLPLAMALGEPGSEIQAPMAMVILFGLATSTALNMLIVPAMYLRFAGE